jgi:hypothetical protein
VLPSLISCFGLKSGGRLVYHFGIGVREQTKPKAKFDRTVLSTAENNAFCHYQAPALSQGSVAGRCLQLRGD